MSRASFGGAQDLSSLFASFYNAYESNLAQQANNASNKARSDQQAADQNEINQWQSGAISDDEFLAYAQARAKDPNNEASDTTYWKQAVRDVNASVKQRKVSDGAQKIMEGIYAGKKSYGDLLNYYKSVQKGLRPNDPLYGQVGDQIASVEKAIYQERLSASRSASGSATQAINSQIDGLQALRDIIGSASDQFDSGATTATIGIPQANGSVKYQTVVIRNPDGTPTADMKALDQQALDTFDQLSKAHIAKGDFSAAASDLSAKAKYVTGEIQPRNTIGPEQQMGHLYKALQDAVYNAGNGMDPAGDWWQVREVANQIHSWQATVNNAPANSDAMKRANPELAAIPETAGQAKSSDQQTTSDFAAKAKALADLATVMSAPDKNTPGALQQSLGVLFAGTDPTSTTSTTAGAIFAGAANVYAGIASGAYALTYTQKDGYAWKPVVNVPIGPGPDGAPQFSQVPVDPATQKPTFDPSKGESLAYTSVEVAGHAIPVLAQASTVDVWNGKIVGPDNKPPSGQSATTMVQVSLPDPTTGDPHIWYQDPNSKGWTRDGFTSSAPAPMPFQGKDVVGAQAIANAKGLDPNGDYFTSAHGVMAHGYALIGGQDWFQNAQANATQKGLNAANARVAAGPQHGFTQSQGVPDLAPLKQMVSDLGIGNLDTLNVRPSLQKAQFPDMNPVDVSNVPHNIAVPSLNLRLPSGLPRTAPNPTLPFPSGPTMPLAPPNGFDVRGGVLR